MVSFQGYAEARDYTHMYSFAQPGSYFRDTEFDVESRPGTIYDFLRNNKDFSIFKKIVRRPDMARQLNQEEADFTVLIPRDSSLSRYQPNFFKDMDIGLAKQILHTSSLNRKINSKLFKSSPVCYYYSLNPDTRLYTTNINGKTRINESVKITEFDIERTNGLIHIVDGLLLPNITNHFMN